ncbi:MAG: 30S ribosomal protein S13 [Candidatus Lightella neohaematopini]|nr:30S ribosomal protein S13 [Candidatus Lightella neohaematopini]MCV2531323.1 30S ribosomal protein S13 [Candidatus Lightella neohaematopini]
MIRIAGVNITENKHICVALRSIYGIGKNTANNICISAKINPYAKVSILSESDINKVRDIISTLTVEGDLRRKITLNIKRLIDLGTYRGLRHKYHLPTRGQRTRTNAKTCKKLKNIN